MSAGGEERVGELITLREVEPGEETENGVPPALLVELVMMVGGTSKGVSGTEGVGGSVVVTEGVAVPVRRSG